MQVDEESRRLQALRALDALDVEEPDVRFESMVLIAQHWFDLPMVSITLVDADRQWRVASYGPLARETCLEGAICPVAMHAEGVYVVDDTALDPRFAPAKDAVGTVVRFYAGAPLHAPTGEPVGSFCVMGPRPRSFSRADRDVLEDLGRWVEQELGRGIKIRTLLHV
jgi:GAF domain-containing protein